ncbi:MAG: glycine oxidase ThiO [Pirellulales bacterium]|nr:glycine oxidase ThiO [Pirellulales bacterium]
MHDTLIVGGGVIGLSLAYELATRGQRVQVIDRGEPASEASWAGAGILPPANSRTAADPLDRLGAVSLDLHADWAERLRDETGIDNGFRRCGALYVARSDTERKELEVLARDGVRRQVEFRSLDVAELARLEPALRASAQDAVWLVPGEYQIRNPRHLKALLAACVAHGVQIIAGIETYDFDVGGGRVRGAVTSAGRLEAGNYCVASGAWSRRLLSRLGIEVPLRPVRGQIVLLQAAVGELRHIVNEGPRYLVPRDDGHILVGSTEEEVGFDKRTTVEGMTGLLQLAVGLVPNLAQARVERSWAGLRPATADRKPIIGRLPELANAYVAAGHFRSGLTLSPGTAVALAQLMAGETPCVSLDTLGPDRF